MAGNEFQSLVDMSKEPMECSVETQVVGEVFFRLDCSCFTLRPSFWDRGSEDSRDNRASCLRMLEDFVSEEFHSYPIPEAKDATDCSPSKLLLSLAQGVLQQLERPDCKRKYSTWFDRVLAHQNAVLERIFRSPVFFRRCIRDNHHGYGARYRAPASNNEKSRGQPHKSEGQLYPACKLRQSNDTP